MAGAWEGIHDTVLVGILHTEVTTLAWSFGLRNLIIPGQIMPVAGMPFDMARNTVCMQALQMGADYVFFLDSDVIPPPDTILRLIKHRKPVVSGIYCRRSPPHGVPVMIRNGQWVTEYPANSLIEVDVVGAGCLLIDCDVLRKLPPQKPGSHWFNWAVHLRGIHPEGECLSEDFMFNTWCKKHGIPTLVDTSIMCRHVGNAQAGYGTLAPLETTPVT